MITRSAGSVIFSNNFLSEFLVFIAITYFTLFCFFMAIETYKKKTGDIKYFFLFVLSHSAMYVFYGSGTAYFMSIAAPALDIALKVLLSVNLVTLIFGS
ncbi:MAG: hypothetical protein KZQ69_14885 [gamma proteobacterium symbiont of Bathyaustriella thionipta]|nr:hypothetical protein [gamma proteobacterium symbiont of Bathyaustriella thionipta]